MMIYINYSNRIRRICYLFGIIYYRNSIVPLRLKTFNATYYLHFKQLYLITPDLNVLRVNDTVILPLYVLFQRL